MPAYTYTDIDPVTKQPVQAAKTQQVAQQPAQQPGAGGFDLEKFAADSAERQMMYAIQHGHRPTQGDYEDAQKAAYQQGFETMRQQQLDQQRRAGELQKQIQFESAKSFLPRTMSPEEIEKGSGLMNAHDQIMMLYNQNNDIPSDHPYRTMNPVGDVVSKLGQQADSRIRLYEATRGGSIISLGRGLLQDTGQVAGKEEAQNLIKNLMPGAGDSPEMSARKTVDMLQMTLNGLHARINSMPSNVDTTALKQEYARTYNDYANIVSQSGSPAQMNNPAANPQTLFGKDFATPNTVQVQQPAVKAGVSAETKASLVAQSSGGFVQLDPTTGKSVIVPPQYGPTTTVSATLPSQTSPGATLIGTTSEDKSSTVPGFMPITQQPTGPTAPPAIPGPAPQNAPRLGQLGPEWGMP